MRLSICLPAALAAMATAGGPPLAVAPNDCLACTTNGTYTHLNATSNNPFCLPLTVNITEVVTPACDCQFFTDPQCKGFPSVPSRLPGPRLRAYKCKSVRGAAGAVMVWRSPESKEGPYTSEKNGWSVCQRFEKSFLGPQKIAQVYQWPGALCKYYEGEKCEGVAKVEYDSCGRGRWSADPRVLVEVFLRKGGIQFGSFTCGRKGKGPGKGPEGE